ncbi:HD-GYP domain, c-di-GMP phosphodiesterase class II (or its inactivated variant) [Bacillus sp. OV322]|uniref:HD-GYP domain-containing protein n=1 Tax=unclassified Bacillus (in: firmicutes) TaxID=185979 RepID=UPI0008F322B1|nr:MULTISPECIES: HD-GYP domain-containing protein [unclassified Bacillus (in: firmicutes)]OIK05394.1 phosphohydrolase [Bacillus sp. MUM 13]SFC16595.1 HD-GYP domain, c-di-GMP phosphodiesterase class II (or its inactivated variant) [Bacillus sp. OV322]
MRVKTHYLEEGCILSKDVIGMTKRPIITKKTIITNEMLEVLQAFLVTDVSVEKTLIDGSWFSPKEIIDEESEEEGSDSTFLTQYLKAVQAYKKLFKNWQAGSIADVAKVRSIIIPLFEKFLENPQELVSLHHYCSKEDYLYHHAISMGIICGFIAKKMNYELADIMQITMGGCLADCGMAKIPPKILDKKTSLTSEEYEEIRKHPIYSLRMLQNTPILKETVKYAIVQHHERLDGSGYPAGRNGKEPHSFSRIVAVADVYHAMTSERIYRNKQSPFKVMEMILQDDFGKFDITVVKTLLECVTTYTIGSRVRLSNGYTAEIIFIDAHSQTRPLVKAADSGEIINLGKTRELFIEEIL